MVTHLFIVYGQPCAELELGMPCHSADRASIILHCPPTKCRRFSFLEKKVSNYYLGLNNDVDVAKKAKKETFMCETGFFPGPEILRANYSLSVIVIHFNF